MAGPAEDDRAHHREEVGLAGPEPPRVPILEYVLLLLLATFWGASYILAKIGIGSIPPMTFICGRSLLAAFWLMLVLRLRRITMPTDLQSWKLFAAQSMINSVVPFVLITSAQQYVDAGLTVVLNSTTPIFVFLITWGITRHEPATGAKLLGTLLGLGGVVIVVGKEAVSGFGQELVAQIVITLATIAFAVGTIRGRTLAHLDPMVAATGSLAFGGMLLVPLSLVVERPWTLSPTAASLTAMLLMSMFSSALGLMLFYRLVRTLGPVAVASQAYLRVPIGVGLAVVLLGERVPPSLFAGLVLVVIGVALMTITLPRRPGRA